MFQELGIIEKIMKTIPEERHKASLISTLVGAGMLLVQYLQENHEKDSLPVEVMYGMILMVGNCFPLISDEEETKIFQFPKQDLTLGEQSQEILYRKLKAVVESLYNFIQEKEKI